MLVAAKLVEAPATSGARPGRAGPGPVGNVGTPGPGPGTAALAPGTAGATVGATTGAGTTAVAAAAAAAFVVLTIGLVAAVFVRRTRPKFVDRERNGFVGAPTTLVGRASAGPSAGGGGSCAFAA